MLGSLKFDLLATAATTTPCEGLRALATPQAMIPTANEVPAGPFVHPGGRGAARREALRRQPPPMRGVAA